MIKIRLAKTGKRNAPFFRLVVADSRTKRNGKIIERIGFYSPKSQPPTFKYDQKRLTHWLSQGAQMTETVRKLIKKKE
jgi:small subunit ribosomal protein S16